MKAVLYARVSDPNTQDTADKVSIQQQLADMRALCERNDWQIAGEYVDNENYKATQNPKRGRVVNPSGERADRPQFLAMLEVVKAGDAEIVLCWRDDRLVRHPRVAVALEDALDVGDAKRNGKPRIEIRDATGAMIDRFTLSIKATIWREENKRRAERTEMGKIATLQQGRWPGHYNRLGYEAMKEQGKRGRKVVLADGEEVQTIKDIFTWYDSGIAVEVIRDKLIARSAEQKGQPGRLQDWARPVIHSILRSEDYTGRAIWNFGNGTEYAIEIPQIIPREQWKRVQNRRERNKQLSTRNARGIYLLQGILVCGECGRAASIQSCHIYYQTLADGTRRRYKRIIPWYRYYCAAPRDYPDEQHPEPYSWHGPSLDWAVWRYIIDNGIKRPDLIRQEVLARQAELQAQGESVEGDIAHARRKLTEVDQERAFYQRQAARGKITEVEFDTRMGETEEAWQYWQTEIDRLKELRDNAASVEASLDYATELLTTLQTQLPGLDQSLEELKAMPREKREEVFKKRQEIVRTLCEEVHIWADGRVELIGVLDGSEASQFELGIPSIL
jgi:DNA invertase Pin-like site-specific DNA recombinase